MSLLTIARSVASRVGIGRPAVVATSTDDLTAQLFDLANESVEEIGKRHGWQRTRVPGQSFTTVAAAFQPNTLPADYDRMAPGRTVWNQGLRRPLTGPVSAEQWAALNGLAISSSMDLYYRLAGTGFLLFPTPAVGQVIAFEYVSVNRVQPANGASKPLFTADDDTVLFPEQLVTKDLVWRWKQAKGLDYAEDFRTFEMAFELEAAADRGETEISTAHWLADLPDNFFPGTITVP